MAHNLLSKVDRALVAYLVSVGAGSAADTYPAKRSADKTIPNTICHSQKWRMLLPNSGVYVVSAQIMVTTDPTLDSGEDGEEKKRTSEDRVAAVFDAFFAGVVSSSTALAQAITAAGRAAGGLGVFTMQSCVVEGGDAGFYERGNAWRDALDLEIVCRPGNES